MKLKITIFLFSAAFLFFFFSLLGTDTTLAKTPCPSGGACVSVSPDMLLAQAATCADTKSCYYNYLQSLYEYLLGLAAIAALGALVYGGVLYIYSGGNPSKSGEAKQWISNALFGLLLVALSYIILNTINPDLLPGFKLKGVYCAKYNLGC
ncbi:MAG: hypothetical protein A3A28_00755 [Candidatus Sungbacteria bacterium RIFCSPLOWO2_01_FULL_47_32]|uniref:Uncharacterized protein n=1 Tax=Candidatus Sungbacteria bacterium RIFCSPHIGHO2_01_FULL_47_32 TaxID=1802264 RepID=A0A1G2K2W8_9BACT|nr:MAG: hypothetical protein A2633_02760 [Candidatus Sungbacteria bacterium RIFCSPHIGHO2_01_FULL_47_32]OHA05137.1 MAG: hypothetical protein A3A28_00755 [Candidatus Sungbacteria bacterium RIFCSPLOWO2_01_FULL_47_32]